MKPTASYAIVSEKSLGQQEYQHLPCVPRFSCRLQVSGRELYEINVTYNRAQVEAIGGVEALIQRTVDDFGLPSGVQRNQYVTSYTWKTPTRKATLLPSGIWT